MFKKTFWKLSLQFIMLQKYSDTLYSKCCKIFKAYLTIMYCWVNYNVILIILANKLQHYYFWFSWTILFLKIKFVMLVFITYKPVYWFTEENQRLFLCDRDMQVNHFNRLHQLLHNWIRMNTMFINRCISMLKKDSISGVFLQVLWIFT